MIRISSAGVTGKNNFFFQFPFFFLLTLRKSSLDMLVFDEMLFHLLSNDIEAVTQTNKLQNIFSPTQNIYPFAAMCTVRVSWCTYFGSNIFIFAFIFDISRVVCVAR